MPFVTFRCAYDQVGSNGIPPPTPTEDHRAYNLRLMALHLNLVAGFDDLLSLDSIDFTPFDYQIKAARTALRRFRGRGMLSEEVGLSVTKRLGRKRRINRLSTWQKHQT